LVGRMYRHLIHEDGLRIRLAAVRDGSVHWDTDARVNDPMYLISPSLTPKPFHEQTMFRPYGEGSQSFSIDVGDKTHTVTVNCSWATEETMQPESGGMPGSEPYGKHALLNLGVSIVRARRELDLVTHWNRGDTFRDRWWGIEVCFPPALDELFGVTNNKQAVTEFTQMAEFFGDEQREREWEGRRDELEEDGDPRFQLMEIAKYIADQRNALRNRLKALQAGRRTKQQTRHTASIEDLASLRIKQRIEEGGPHVEIADDVTDDKTKHDAVFQELHHEGGVSKRDAGEIADAVVQRDRKIIFVEREDDSDAFFSAKALPGIHEVRINTEHPVYAGLLEVLDPNDPSAEDADELRVRLGKASDTLKMMLCAWVRYELEARDMRQRQIRDARREWGKMVRRFLEED
jgi:hypothetical protein